MELKLKVDAASQRKVDQALSQFGVQVRLGLTELVRMTAMEMGGNIVRKIQRGGRSGRTYEKYDPRRTHTASGPGEAPKTDTGRLASSVDYEASGLEASVFSTALYAAYLEAGTRHMKPRPVWRPERDEAQKRLARRVVGMLRQMTGGT